MNQHPGLTPQLTIPPITINLSAPERDTLLKNVPLPNNIVARLRFALHTAHGLEVTLSNDEVLVFGEAVEQSLPRIRQRNDALLIEGFFERFVTTVHDICAESVGFSEGPDFPPDMPEAMREAIQQLLDSGEYETPEALMEALRRAVIETDDSRHERLFGLTIGDVIKLLRADWTEPTSLLWLDERIPREQLAGSSYCMNALRFLALTESTGGFKLTPKKNLNRESVRLLLDSGSFPEVDTGQLLRYSKVINEIDVRPLHMVHLLLRETKMVRHFKGKMLITKAGREVLAKDRAGLLQCGMFRALFQEFNLAYLDRLPDYDSVQSTIAFILYAIYRSAQEPIAAGELMEKAYTPSVAESFSQAGFARHGLLALYTRVLYPLKEFGLIDIEVIGKKYERDLAQNRVCVTPLFNAMIHFDLGNG